MSSSKRILVILSLKNTIIIHLQIDKYFWRVGVSTTVGGWTGAVLDMHFIIDVLSFTTCCSIRGRINQLVRNMIICIQKYRLIFLIFHVNKMDSRKENTKRNIKLSSLPRVLKTPRWVNNYFLNKTGNKWASKSKTEIVVSVIFLVYVKIISVAIFLPYLYFYIHFILINVATFTARIVKHHYNNGKVRTRNSVLLEYNLWLTFFRFKTNTNYG